jgi:DNA-binding NarL/FixJ family response regulator
MNKKSMQKYKYDLSIRIVIIEDDEIIRKGYGFLMENTEGFKVVDTYSSVENSLEKIKEDNPDIILLDVGLQGISGVDGIPILKKIVPDVQILMVTVYESEEIILKALANGASGYITKDSSPEKIMESVNEIMQGGGPMSSRIASLVIKSFHRNHRDSPLSKRETQILLEIAAGKSRGKIAEEFFIDYETVKTHIKNIYFKLNVHSRDEAIREAKKSKFI